MNSSNDKSGEITDVHEGSLKDDAAGVIRDSDDEFEGDIQKKTGPAHQYTAAIQDAIKKGKSLFRLKLK